MSRSTARLVSDLLLAAAAGAVVYQILRNPALRRLAWQLTKGAVTTAIPAAVARDIREAWEESGRAA